MFNIINSPERQSMVRVGDPRRTQSDLDIQDRDHIHALHQNTDINHGSSDGGEFYTAIGTDGISL